jgi:hypothetical protein
MDGYFVAMPQSPHLLKRLNDLYRGLAQLGEFF